MDKQFCDCAAGSFCFKGIYIILLALMINLWLVMLSFSIVFTFSRIFLIPREIVSWLK